MSSNVKSSNDTKWINSQLNEIDSILSSYLIPIISGFGLITCILNFLIIINFKKKRTFHKYIIVRYSLVFLLFLLKLSNFYKMSTVDLSAKIGTTYFRLLYSYFLNTILCRMLIFCINYNMIFLLLNRYNGLRYGYKSSIFVNLKMKFLVFLLIFIGFLLSVPSWFLFEIRMTEFDSFYLHLESSKKLYAFISLIFFQIVEMLIPFILMAYYSSLISKLFKKKTVTKFGKKTRHKIYSYHKNFCLFFFNRSSYRFFIHDIE